MTNHLFVIFCSVSLLFIVIGALILCSPATKKERYVQTTAVVLSRMMDGDGAIFPVLEFQADGKPQQYKPRFPVSDSFPVQNGGSVSILYCASGFPGFRTYSVLLDDGGASQQKLIHIYFLIGALFIFIGFLLFIPAFLLLKKK